MRFAVPIAMMAVLAGCSTLEDPFLTGSVSGVSGLAPALTQEVSPANALGGLAPAIGAPRSVRQTAPGGENTIRQVIVYANTTRLPGENMLIVEGGRGTDGRYRRVPSRTQLQAEMQNAMPGVAMRISNVIGQNAYGVYGYATGPYAGGSCIYGWQVTEPRGSYPTQVRLRFCHERISEERIPLLMQGLTLRPLNSGLISALRGIRGPSLAGMGSFFGGDGLLDRPAPRMEAPAAYAQPPMAASPMAYVAPPVAYAAPPVAYAAPPAYAPPPVAYAAPPAVYAPPAVAYAPPPVAQERPAAAAPAPRPAPQPAMPAPQMAAPAFAPAIQPAIAPQQQPVQPILNAARVPMPGEKRLGAPQAQTANEAASPEMMADLKRKAADAWNAARARLGTTTTASAAP